MPGCCFGLGLLLNCWAVGLLGSGAALVLWSVAPLLFCCCAGLWALAPGVFFGRCSDCWWGLGLRVMPS
eukprot:11101898-Alexandrium_andersonii.AAC.1